MLLSRLFCHPRGVEIVWKFSDGAPRGQARARELVADSVEAIPKIDAKLADPDYVWHFAPAILAGVGVRGLADRPGFPEYAVQIGQVLSRSVVENVLDQLSTAVFACGLATGPAGLAVSGVLDVALSGATSAVVFLREREQDLAATATAFSAEDDRWAVPPTYLETALAGAAALISAKGLLEGPVRDLLHTMRTPRPHGVPHPGPMPHSPSAHNPSAPSHVKGDPHAGGAGVRGVEARGTHAAPAHPDVDPRGIGARGEKYEAAARRETESRLGRVRRGDVRQPGRRRSWSAGTGRTATCCTTCRTSCGTPRRRTADVREGHRREGHREYRHGGQGPRRRAARDFGSRGQSTRGFRYDRRTAGHTRPQSD